MTIIGWRFAHPGSESRGFDPRSSWAQRVHSNERACMQRGRLRGVEGLLGCNV